MFAGLLPFLAILAVRSTRRSPQIVRRKSARGPANDVQSFRDGIEVVLEQVAYRSSVIAADAWPSMRCTAFTLAPALTARDAAVCRSSCGVSPGWPISAAALSNHNARALRLRKTPPIGDVNARSSRSLPASATTRSSTSDRGIGTERRSCDFGVRDGLAAGMILDDIVAEYPTITPAGVHAAAAYGAALARDELLLLGTAERRPKLYQK